MSTNTDIIVTKHRINQLSKGIPYAAGRNFGMISSPRKVSLTKKIYRFIDFERNSYPGVKAVVRKFEYDSFRNSELALICYPFGLLQYILSVENLKLGSEISNFGSNIGDSMALKNLKGGSIINNLGLYKKSCGVFIRSAGVSAILVRNSNNFSLVKLKSGELRLFNDNVMCVKGVVSNGKWFLRNLKKAGTAIKLLNKRPRNRALARNPVDHPMGGRTKGGVSLNPKGQYSKWTPSAKNLVKYRVLIKRKSKLNTF